MSKTFCWAKEARHKRVDSAWVHLYEIIEWAKLIYSDRKQVSGCLRLGEGVWWQRSGRELSGEMEVLSLDVVGITWYMHLTQTIKLYTLNCCILMVFKLHLNFAYFSKGKVEWYLEENVAPQAKGLISSVLQFHSIQTCCLIPLCPSLPSMKRRWRCWDCVAKDWVAQNTNLK